MIYDITLLFNSHRQRKNNSNSQWIFYSAIERNAEKCGLREMCPKQDLLGLPQYFTEPELEGSPAKVCCCINTCNMFSNYTELHYRASATMLYSIYINFVNCRLSQDNLQSILLLLLLRQLLLLLLLLNVVESTSFSHLSNI